MRRQVEDEAESPPIELPSFAKMFPKPSIVEGTCRFLGDLLVEKGILGTVVVDFFDGSAKKANKDDLPFASAVMTLTEHSIGEMPPQFCPIEEMATGLAHMN